MREEFSAEISVPGGIDKLKVISEDREIEVIGGKFTERFTPYQVHIYTSNLDFQDTINLEAVEKEIRKANGMFVFPGDK